MMNQTPHSNLKPSARAGRTHSFTLMEILAAISIIAILAALVIPVIGNAKLQAKRARARAEMDGLRVALRSYYQDYGCWAPTFGTTWADWSTMLNGNINPITGNAAGTSDWSTTNNVRAIRFLEFKRDSVTPAGDFLDPFGGKYCFLTDNGDIAVGRVGWSDVVREDNQVDNPNGGSGIQTQIAIYNFGPDMTDNNGVSTSDDVRTWSN